MKTIEEWIYIWADDWHDTWRLIEAVRVEAMSQARREALEETAALLREQARRLVMSTQKPEDPLPCPFCNIFPKIELSSRGVAVVCASMHKTRGHYACVEEPTRAAAIAAWNTRQRDGK